MDNKERRDFITERQLLENRIKSAKELEKQAKKHRQSLEGDLHRLQMECPHENVEVSGTWQGGGKYYDKSHCKDCNKKGDRYNRNRTLEENRRKWYKNKSEEEIQLLTPKGDESFFSEYNW